MHTWVKGLADFPSEIPIHFFSVKAIMAASPCVSLRSVVLLCYVLETIRELLRLLKPGLYLCWFSTVTIVSYHELSGLKQQQLISLQFYRSEA